MACKSYEENGAGGELTSVLTELYAEHLASGGGRITVDQLLKGAFDRGRYTDLQPQLQLSVDDFLDEAINDESELLAKIARVSRYFQRSTRDGIE